jgi:hypothetical protein
MIHMNVPFDLLFLLFGAAAVGGLFLSRRDKKPWATAGVVLLVLGMTGLTVISFLARQQQGIAQPADR